MILVTGGTGLVGAHLLYALAAQGEKIRATHRESSSFKDVKRVFNYNPDGEELFNKIEWVPANLLDIIALEQALEGIHSLFHCAAYISFDPAKTKLLKKVNKEGTANLVNLALAKKVDCLYFVSSVATLGNMLDGSAITESTSWNPQDKNSGYAMSKYGAEMEVWRGVQEGLPAVIVNPGVILGSGHWNSASGGLIPHIANGQRFYPKGTMNVVDVKDVVRALLLCCEQSESRGQNYILVGSNLSYGELFGKILKAMNKPQRIKPISKAWLKLAAILNYMGSKLFKSKRILTLSLVDAMYSNQHYSSAKIAEHLNFEFTPLDETINRIVARFNSQNP